MARAAQRPPPPSGRQEDFIAGYPLRGLVTLVVIAMHVAYVAKIRPTVGFGEAFGQPWGYLMSSAYNTIWIFLILSGYLIARPFLRAYVDARPMPSIRGYARNRMLRILPGAWVLLPLVFLWHGTKGASAGEVIAIFAFVQTYFPSEASQLVTHLWTVDVDMAFYVLLPIGMAALVALTPRRLSRDRRFAAVAAALALVAAGSLAFRALSPFDQRYEYAIPSMLLGLVAGIAVALVELRWRERLRAVPHRPPLVAAIALAGVGCWALGRIFEPSAYAWRGLLAAGGAALIVGAILLKQWTGGGAWRLLDNRPLSWIGERSYSIYVIHLPIVLAIRQLPSREDSPWTILLVTTPVAAAISIALGALAYRFVELPALRLKRPYEGPGPEPVSGIAPEPAAAR